jgi:hypothetical protein
MSSTKVVSKYIKIYSQDAKTRQEQNKWYNNFINLIIKKSNYAEEPLWLKHRLDELYSNDNYYQSYYKNITVLDTLKKSIVVDPVNYICTVFRAYSIKENISANYAFMYSLDKKFHDILGLADVDITPVKIMYCARPALISQDGEYRNGILNMSQLYTLEKKYAYIYQDVELYLTQKNEKSELNLEYENFHPQLKIEQSAEVLDQVIVNDRLMIRFYIQFWFIEVYNLSTGMQENHTNIKFNKIFFSDIKEDIAMLKFIIDKYGKEKIDEMILYMSTPIVTKTAEGGKLGLATYALGQKLRPLNVSEVQEPFNIKYQAWREIFFNQYVNDLIANFISPNFPLFIDWFYIKNSKKGLFDNEQQYNKLEYSERSEIIVRKLRETQRLTYMSDWFRNKNKSKYLNDVFKSLDHKIDSPIDFTKNNLMMSNVTLGYIIEYVGRTFADILILNKSKVWTTKVRDILNNHSVFKKYIFDVIYGLLSMNMKMGMMQGDLHTNNVTIKTNNNAVITDKNPHALYKIFDYYFIMPHWGTYSCIIDFSRGIIIPENIKDRLSIFKNSDEYLEFIDDQTERIIKKYQDVFPSFAKTNSERILDMIHNNFEKFFKVFTAMDIYDFSSKLEKYLDKHMIDDNVNLLRKIKKISEHYLTSIMLSILNNPNTEVEWPMFQILKECFIDNIININNKPEKISIIDYWILDKPIQYSFSSYNKFPPHMKDEVGIKNPDMPNKVTHIDYFDIINERRQKYERYKHKCMGMVNYIAERHQHKYK